MHAVVNVNTSNVVIALRGILLSKQIRTLSDQNQFCLDTLCSYVLAIKPDTHQLKANTCLVS